MFRCGIDKPITLADVAAMQSARYESFQQFVDNAFSIYKITFPEQTDKWQEAVCTCPAFDSDYMCKHIIHIACNLGLHASADGPLEEDYYDVPLFVSKRGRPKRTTIALQLE